VLDQPVPAPPSQQKKERRKWFSPVFAEHKKWWLGLIVASLAASILRMVLANEIRGSFILNVLPRLLASTSVFLGLAGLFAAVHAGIFRLTEKRKMSSSEYMRTFTGWWCVIVLLSVLELPSKTKDPADLRMFGQGATSQPTEAASNEPQVRWPRAFNMVEQGKQATLSPVEPQPPKLGNLLADDMGRAYGYYLGQELSIERLSDKFPQLRKRLLTAQAEFDLRFMPAFKTIDRVLTEKNRPWVESRANLQAEVSKQINVKQMTPDQAETYAAEVEKRSRGEIPSPILETLLMFHPRYIKAPAEEYLAGFKREYRSDGSGKAKGMKVGIVYPMSWKADESRRPNIVKKFVSENGHGFEIVSIVILEVPSSVQSPVTAKDLEDIRQTRFWEAVAVGAKTLDSGTVRLLGQPAIWGEYTWKANQAGIDMELHGFDLMFIYDSRLVGISFHNAVMPLNSNETAQQRFERYAPLFQLMISSVDVFNRYEK
jgi:hypothetical protein